MTSAPAPCATTDSEERARARRARRHGLLASALALLAVAASLWVSDWVTVQNERTVFTAECRGAWQGAHCDGTLVAGPRHRFRALKVHGEVLFWTLGSSEPSGKLAACRIVNGRNWTCPESPEGARSITLQMALGQPVKRTNPAAPAFHAVPKWRWWLLRLGLPAGSDAED